MSTTTTLAIGTTVYNPAGFRAHAFRCTVRLTDLRGAGKRGARLQEVSMYHQYRDLTPELVDTIGTALDAAESFELAATLLRCFAACEGYEVHENELRGVDVEPGPPIVRDTPEFYLEVGATEFVCRDKRDTNNLPAFIPPQRGRATAVKALHRLMQREVHGVEVHGIASMTFDELCSLLSRLGIAKHTFCRMD